MNRINKNANPLGWKVAHSIKELLASSKLVNEYELELSKADNNVVNHFITIAEFLFESKLNTLDLIGKDEFINLLPRKVNISLTCIFEQLDINYMSFKYIMNIVNPIYLNYTIDVCPFRMVSYLLHSSSYQIATELNSHRLIDLKYCLSDNKVLIDKKNYDLFTTLKRFVIAIHLGLIPWDFDLSYPIQQMAKFCYETYISISKNNTISYNSFVKIMNDIAINLNVESNYITIFEEENDFRSDLLNTLSQFSRVKPFIKTEKIDEYKVFKMEPAYEYWFETLGIILLEITTKDQIFNFTDMEKFKSLVKNNYHYQVLLRFYLAEDSTVLINNSTVLQEAVDYLNEIRYLIK